MNVKSKERLAENLKETKLIMDKLDALNMKKHIQSVNLITEELI